MVQPVRAGQAIDHRLVPGTTHPTSSTSSSTSSTTRPRDEYYHPLEGIARSERVADPFEEQVARLQSEEGLPVRDGLEEHAIEHVVEHQTGVLRHKEHGGGVHLQLVALQSDPLDDEAEDSAEHDEDHEQGDESDVRCVVVREVPEKGSVVDQEGVQAVDQDRVDSTHHPESIPAAYDHWSLQQQSFSK